MDTFALHQVIYSNSSLHTQQSISPLLFVLLLIKFSCSFQCQFPIQWLFGLRRLIATWHTNLVMVSATIKHSEVSVNIVSPPHVHMFLKWAQKQHREICYLICRSLGISRIFLLLKVEYQMFELMFAAVLFLVWWWWRIMDHLRPFSQSFPHRLLFHIWFCGPSTVQTQIIFFLSLCITFFF